jgi:hypothetical protein
MFQAGSRIAPADRSIFISRAGQEWRSPGSQKRIYDGAVYPALKVA